MIEARSKRILAQPYGYKSVKDITEEEATALKHVLGSSYSLEENYDYNNAPIINFYNLDQMDSLFARKFKEGKDIAFIVSVADWTQHTFRNTRSLNTIIKKHESYHSVYKEGFFNLSNAVIIFENFFKFLELPENEKTKNSKGEQEYEADIKHAYLSDLCKISIHLYCHNKKINNIEDKEISLKWFKKFFNEVKDFYSNKGKDNYYFSRYTLDMLSEVLKFSKKITKEDEVLQVIMPDIEINMPKLWKEMDYVVKLRFFKYLIPGTDSFKIIEELLGQTVGDDAILLSIKKEINSEEIKYKNTVIYFLVKYWHKLMPDECNDISKILLKNITSSNTLTYLEPLMYVITPLDKIINIFESKSFSEEIKSSDIYKKCYGVLESRTLNIHLQENLVIKHGKDKVQKL